LQSVVYFNVAHRLVTPGAPQRKTSRELAQYASFVDFNPRLDVADEPAPKSNP